MTRIGWPRPGKWWPYALSVLLCGGAALLMLRAFIHSRLDVIVPLLFLTVPLLAAALWGQGPALCGTLTAAVTFAFFLFEPIGRWRVHNSTARASLALMLLLAAGFTLFLTSDTHSRT